MASNQKDYKLNTNNNNISQKEHLNNINSIRIYKLGKKPKLYEQLLSFMNSNINKEFRSFSLLAICGATDKAKFIVDKNFQKAFSQLTTNQKIQLYQKAVNNGIYILDPKKDKQQIEQQINQQISKILPNKNTQFYITIHEGFKSNQQIKINLQGFKFISKKLFSIDLQNYIIRKSKKKNSRCFVLQAINSSQPQTIRYSFANYQQQNLHNNVIQKLIDIGFKNTIKNMLLQAKITQSSKNISSSSPNQELRHSYGKLRQTQKNIQEDQQANSETNNQNKSPIFNLQSSNKFIQFSKNLAEVKKNTINFQGNNLIDQLINSKKKIQDNKIFNLNKNKRQEQKLVQQQTTQQNLFSYVLKSQNHIKQPISQVKKQFILQVNQKSQPLIQIIKYKNIFEIILPDYNLRQIQNHRIFQRQIYHSKNFIIYQHAGNPQRFKVVLILQNIKSIDQIYNLLINADLLKKWNNQADQSQIKISLSADNCLICYQKHKRINNWFKQRDYLYLRHAFTYKTVRYICQKSIQHTSFIPFQSIQRGVIKHFVTKIKDIGKKKIQIILDALFDHEGFLGLYKKQQLTLRFLKQYEKLQRYANNNQNNSFQTYCNLDWNIDWIENNPNCASNLNLLSQQFINQGSQIDYNQIMVENQSVQSQQFYSVVDQNQGKSTNRSNHKVQNTSNVYQQKPQIQDQEDQFSKQKQISKQIQLDSQGYCILPQKYFKKKHIMLPVESPSIKIQKTFQNILLKNDFIYDKQGGMKLVNKKKIQAQDNVLGFVMKTMKKNLFSGKSILSISLPVEIFKKDSNTQTLCQSMRLGPVFLQRAFKDKSSIERMKWAIAFGLSNSILYFEIQKPFNPILGQTYQGHINGCPIYAEQISHHPPITALYFVGRGYRVYASIQSKVFLHLNSGDGINLGYYTIQFNDGQIIKFQTAPGELSGFTLGQRKYRYKDRMYVFDQNNCLYSELLFQQPSLGLFSKKTWQFGDQLGGQIVSVSQNFMDKFINSKDKISPKPKDIQQTYSKVDGRWLYHLNFDGKTYYDIENQMPFQMINYEYSLNSDAKYRQDLIYRGMNDLAKSQKHKEFLENKQRKDRKQKQKYHGAKGH